MKLDVYFEKDNGLHFNPIPIYEGYFEYLKSKYTDIQFNFYNSWELRTPENYKGPSCIHSSLFMRIVNPDNGKFLIISYWDVARNLFNPKNEYYVANEKLIAFYTSIGINADRDFAYELCSPPIKYIPISLCLAKSTDDELIENTRNLNIQREFKRKPRFRGSCYAFRNFLKEDPRFEIFNIYNKEERLEKEEYFAEMFSSKINISLNGIGESCFRDIEILGLGCTLLRPKLSVEFHNKLIPNYHYASVEVKDQTNFNDLADAIYAKYDWLSRNPDIADSIAENGRNWYLKNGSTIKNIEILKETIKIENLWTQ